tara:strand:- start:4707 stop:5690 length:984 start_codon:yes stop_codon:yes gene_type:complete
MVIKFNPTIIKKKSSDKIKYTYINNNKLVNDKKIIKYIESLKIPPNWNDTKIDISKKTLLHAIGIDKSGKKQYLYSAQHEINRDKKKFSKLIYFAKNIDKINNKINYYLKNNEKSKEHYICLIVKILLTCSFRIGEHTCMIKHNSRGLTTIQCKHLNIQNKNNNILIDFIGKKGVRNICKINKKNNPLIYKNIINICNNRKPNDFVFMFKNKRITFLDINNFLKKFNITSKTIRTWNLNKLLIENLINNLNVYDKTKRKKIINIILKKQAKKLYHTLAITKRSYLFTPLKDMYINDIYLLKEILKIDNKKLNNKDRLLLILEYYFKT